MKNRLWIGLGRVLYVFTWPLVYLRVGVSGDRTRVVVVADGQVLVVKDWLGNGRWKLPGGGLHRGEEPAHGASRELREETGLDIRPDQLQIFTRQKAVARHLAPMLVCFRLDLNEIITPKLAHGEIAAVAWVPLPDLLKPGVTTENTHKILVTYSIVSL